MLDYIGIAPACPYSSILQHSTMKSKDRTCEVVPLRACPRCGSAYFAQGAQCDYPLENASSLLYKISTFPVRLLHKGA